MSTSAGTSSSSNGGGGGGGSSRSLCGVDLAFCADQKASMLEANAWGFAFVCLPLFHPRSGSGRCQAEPENGAKPDAAEAQRRRLPATRADQLTIDGDDWSRFVVGKASHWLLCDSQWERERRESLAALVAELSWADHIGLPAFLLPLRDGRCASLARAVLAFFQRERCSFSLWVRVPMMAAAATDEAAAATDEAAAATDEAAAATDEAAAATDEATGNGGQQQQQRQPQQLVDEADPWLWWHRFSRMCDLIMGKLGVALEVTADLPEPAALRRWFAEPVKALLLPTSLFLTNKQGYPVLSKAHQQLVSDFFKLRLQVIITGSCRHDKGMPSYQQYVNWLHRHTPSDLYSSHGRNYEDALQEPLQPLADNLHSGTYQVFEMDPYKYRAYKEAVRQALVEMVPDSEAASRLVTIAVLGAGRGPLVQECLAAGRLSGRKVRVFAVEKNDNAVNTLLNRALSEWPDSVTVLPTDMRRLKPTDFQADIFVSELLGSFGDNELSPECLDGAMQCLAEGGVSVPKSYTSYLAPIHSAAVYREVTRQRDAEKPHYTFLETPYVCNLVNCDLLARPQPAFTFRHPRPAPGEEEGDGGEASTNERHVELTFIADHAGVLHGFAGYFDSCLYGSVSMSILPEDHSPDLFSWFPLVFPLHHCVPVKCGDRITIAMWRVVTEKAVWYEWTLLEPMVLPIHNPNGRSNTINLF